jgi:hypothetical protein
VNKLKVVPGSAQSSSNLATKNVRYMEVNKYGHNLQTQIFYTLYDEYNIVIHLMSIYCPTKYCNMWTYRRYPSSISSILEIIRLVCWNQWWSFRPLLPEHQDAAPVQEVQDGEQSSCPAEWNREPPQRYCYTTLHNAPQRYTTPHNATQRHTTNRQIAAVGTSNTATGWD